MQEMQDNLQKIANAYQTLQQMPDVQVGQTPKTEVWKDGKVKLYRYEPTNPIKTTIPVLINYALVNRYEMMDLQSDRSFMKNLLDAGIALYILDYGYPTMADQYNTMEDYLNWIDDAVEYIHTTHKISQVNLMGICQGGTFATIYAALYPQKVKNLVTLVAPFDFSTNEGLLFSWSKSMDIDKMVDGYRNIPGSFLNTGFDMLKPMMKINKMKGLTDMLEEPSKAENFMRMEKWIADSPDQAGECFRKFVKDLYQGNKLIKGEFEIFGRIVNLKDITMPLLNIYATEDHLVPPASTIPLNDYVGSKDKELYKFAGGHIGVFVGGRSQKELAPAVSSWLLTRDK